MDRRHYNRFMMKRFLTIIAAAASLLCSCEKAPTVINESSPEFSGRMTVVYEGDDFNQDGIKVLVGIDPTQTTVDIKLQKVKFVPAMPVNIDVTIMKVPLTQEEDGNWTFSADGITPWALGGPYDTYRVDRLQGTLTDKTLDFSLDFYNTRKKTGYPTSYSGRR